MDPWAQVFDPCRGCHSALVGKAVRHTASPSLQRSHTVPAAHGWVNNRDTTTMAGDGDGVEEPVKVCVVCLDAEASHAFVPCGHHCVCGGCGEEMMRATRRRRRAACPVCRQRADNLIRIY